MVSPSTASLLPPTPLFPPLFLPSSHPFPPLSTQQADGVHFLVAAVHLESGSPSDGAKVELRAAQLRALLADLDARVAALAPALGQCAVVLGGDLNALREEFVHGNTEIFFECAAVRGVEPALKRPAAGAERQEPPSPPVASLGPLPLGELRLCVGATDGGWLVEGTVSTHLGSRCTRAGSTMMIDFLMFGGVAFEGAPLPAATPVLIVPAADEAAAADPADGVRCAVTSWGSDHLPVACDLLVRSKASAKRQRRSLVLEVR